MPKPEKFVFVCINQRPEGHPKGSCTLRGSAEVVNELREQLDARGLKGKVRMVRTRCLGPCANGPIIAIYPDDVWYKKVKGVDVQEIVEQHLVGGLPVERLRLGDEEWD